MRQNLPGKFRELLLYGKTFPENPVGRCDFGKKVNLPGASPELCIELLKSAPVDSEEENRPCKFYASSDENNIPRILREACGAFKEE